MLNPIPLPSLKRLSWYVEIMDGLQADGRRRVSCTDFANALYVDPTLARKDIAATGAKGRPRIGYELAVLRGHLADFLGLDNPGDVFVAGGGPETRALLADAAFAACGANVLALFDDTPFRIGVRFGERRVHPLAKLPNLASRMHVQGGILTCPLIARDAVQVMLRCGVRRIWNFTPVEIPLEPEAVRAGARIMSFTLGQPLPAWQDEDAKTRAVAL